MRWPAANEYQEAVQNPSYSFNNPALRTGQPALNNLGLPKVASGNFACVFKIQTSNDSYAVRCFSREVSDQQRRYNLLSQHLSGFWLPTLVGFEYIVEGIQIRGHWFPIVRMEWVEGETLDTFIQSHLHEPDMLRHLAAQWRGIIAGIYGAHMAHGDLQHGNVVVDQGGFMRLVDYDPMYVPALKGEKSPELGHPDYEHPQRSEDDFSDNLDNFAALVIYISLIALVAEPELWGSFHTGNNLILTRKDYMDPIKSPCLKQLKGNPDTNVRTLTDILIDFCSKLPTQVIDLENVLNSVKLSSVPEYKATQKQGRHRIPVQVPVQSKPPKNRGKSMGTSSSTTLRCPKCGQSNKKIDLYCTKCATVLKKMQCKGCGAAIPKNASFCRQCGHKQ